MAAGAGQGSVVEELTMWLGISDLEGNTWT